MAGTAVWISRDACKHMHIIWPRLYIDTRLLHVKK